MISGSIVVHKSPPEQLQKALECALGGVDKMWVIDNGPDDSLRSVVEKFGNRVCYRHVENRGFGAGHNAAIREAMSEDFDYHLVMNADVYWKEDVLTPIVRYMDKNKDVGMMMPKVRYPDGVLQFANRMLPTPWDVFAKRFLPARFTRKRIERYLLADIDHDVPLNTPYLLGSFLMFRMGALRKEGLFDERFFMYPEDIDITRRMHENWTTLYWPEVEIVHEHAAASRRSMSMLKIHILNMIKYFNKWGWFIDKSRRAANRRLREVAKRAPTLVKGRG